MKRPIRKSKRRPSILKNRKHDFPIASMCGGIILQPSCGHDPQANEPCRSGGTGRRAAFRAQYPYGCGGSSPPFGILSCLVKLLVRRHPCVFLIPWPIHHPKIPTESASSRSCFRLRSTTSGPSSAASPSSGWTAPLGSAPPVSPEKQWSRLPPIP